MTNCEASALLWRVLMYLQHMANRQRLDQYRADYFDAAHIVHTSMNSIDWRS